MMEIGKMEFLAISKFASIFLLAKYMPPWPKRKNIKNTERYGKTKD